MGKVSVWTGFGIASLLWVPIYLVVGYLTMYFGWDKTIHPLIWLPIAAVIVFVVAIPYLKYVEKKSQ
jgi:Na+-transporting methylmalonyl-CoA/oxaloacetate decarboxylase beta subunit